MQKQNVDFRGDRVRRYFSNLMHQKKCIYLMLGLLFVIILMLLPLMNSGFFGDDAANSFIKGDLQYTHQNLAQGILGSIKSWLYAGRLFPIASIIGYFLFTFASDLIVYKSLIIVSLIINILLFGYFIRIITNSTSLSFLSMLIMPIFFQFREYHDPIMSFNMLQQSIFLFIILSLISLIFYIKNDRKIYLFLSLSMYLLSILTYEIALPFFMLHFLIIYIYHPNKNFTFILKNSAPFFLISLVCLLIPIIIQINLSIPIISGGEYITSSTRYLGNVPNLNIKDFIITFVKQNVAAFPLSYQIPKYLSRPPHNLDDVMGLFNTMSIIIAAIYFSLSVVILKYVHKEILEKKISGLDVWRLSIIGLLVLILPSVLVSLSSRYQKEIYWGVGYLPVYISYFGVAMVTICTILFILIKISTYNKNIILVAFMLIAMIISITGALTYTNNGTVIENLNHNWLYPRLIIEDALNDGLFKFVPDDSILLVDSSNPWWEQPGFYLMHSGVRLRSVESNGAMSKQYLSDKLPDAAFISNDRGVYSFRFSKSDNVFYLRYGSQSRGDGYAVLGEITDLLASNMSLKIVTACNVYIYAHKQNVLCPVNEICVEGYWLKNDSTLNYEPFRFEEDELKLISSGKEWKLFSIPGEDQIIDVGSLNIYSIYNYDPIGTFGFPKKYDLNFINGFWGFEDWSGTPTSWMNADAILSVTSRENRTANLSLQMISFYRNRTLEITTVGAPVAQFAVPTGFFINVSMPISLDKGVNAVRMHVPEGCERPSDKPDLGNPDPRCLSVAVQNLTVT